MRQTNIATAVPAFWRALGVDHRELHVCFILTSFVLLALFREQIQTYNMW
jgi:hypothetical protein